MEALSCCGPLPPRRTARARRQVAPRAGLCRKSWTRVARTSVDERGGTRVRVCGRSVQRMPRAKCADCGERRHRRPLFFSVASAGADAAAGASRPATAPARDSTPPRLCRHNPAASTCRDRRGRGARGAKKPRRERRFEQRCRPCTRETQGAATRGRGARKSQSRRKARTMPGASITVAAGEGWAARPRRV